MARTSPAVSRSVCDSWHTIRQSHYLPIFSLDWAPPQMAGPIFVMRRRSHDPTAGENRHLLAMRVVTGEQTEKPIPAARFPIQHEIQQLQKQLSDFNERIIELENEGHRGHAMEVLKAKAIDFARQIDELRCLLVVPLPK